MADLEADVIATRRWPFVPVCIVLPPWGPLFAVIAWAAVERGDLLPAAAALIACGSFTGLWLWVFLPILKPRRLISSADGLRYEGVFRRREWPWSRFDRAVGAGALALRYQGPDGRPSTLNAGPFWRGGIEAVDRAVRRRSVGRPG